MKKIHYLLLAMISLTVASSCKKFDKLNTNPDVPTSVSPDLLMTSIMKGAYRFWNPNSTDYSTAQLQAKQCANLENTPNPYQYYSSFSPYGSFGGAQTLTALNRMVDFAAGNPAKPSYEGYRLLYKANYGISVATDMGDAPYSEAGMAEQGVTKPKYDKAADIIVAALNDLKAAEAKFAQGVNFTGDITSYAGNATKWRRLCNALQLNALMTISKKITPAQKARFAEIVAAGNLLSGNADVFQLPYLDNANATYPFYGGENSRLNLAMSKLMVDLLKSVNDRRLFYFGEPAAYKITAGLLENDFAAYEGAPTELSSNALALNKAAGKYTLINKRYSSSVSRIGDPFLFFSYAEQCFIIAEAIEEGWVSGSAKTYYENGVKAQLDYYRTLSTVIQSNLHGMAITQSYIDNYFTGEAAYKTGGTKEDRLKQIWMQRYFLGFMNGGGSAYRTYLRTGYPVFPIDPATSLNSAAPTMAPKRNMYPTDEITKNPINYKKAVAEQYGGFDEVNKTPWWLQ
ncbi:SusD/RagB family nutrient-binding outer membrane lipoprotein [Ferruginibacter sp.]|nr:SusD/RagB family nutrient-binding outer membrane lipoprotein [Ferruginibacter sp.]